MNLPASSLNALFSAPRPIKRIISVFSDLVFLVCAFWFALLVRFDSFTIFQEKTNWLLLAVLIPIALAINVRLGLYRAVIRYISSKAATNIVGAVVLTSIALVLLSYYLHLPLPRTVPAIFAAFLMIFIGGSRFIVIAALSSPSSKNKERVIIYGAGSSGRQLAHSLFQGGEYLPIAFVDDDKRLQNSMVQGVMVFNRNQIKSIIDRYNIKRVLLAMPNDSKKRIAKILNRLESLSVQILSIPGSADLVSGKAKIDELREVSIEDLLGRDPVKPNLELLSANIFNKVVMVTGAGGSIGSELCRQIILQKPTTIVLFELSEIALYNINHELVALEQELDYTVKIVPLLGSVQSKNRTLKVMRTFNVQTVYHAAAYKHVPVVENNVIEGVRNNVFGTLFVAESAIEAGVESFVLISTDKAVRPTNVMGTTKRMAELILQALADNTSKTRFCMVRFGNVLGSSGSVVPLFKKQIKQGGPVTVTHPKIIRYFMTIPEAAQLVIQAGAMGEGGDVFVLDMGEPVVISDLAKKIINLSGFSVQSKENPEGDIAIEYSGLRHGEKLFEELLIGNNVSGTEHPRISKAQEEFLAWSDLENILIQLDDACHNSSHKVIQSLLLKAPTGFEPKDGICDLLWNEKLNEAL